jgi:methyl-accepting chemotaxis protein
MLNRLTVSATLKCIIAIAVAAVAIVLGHEAHQSWSRLQVATRLAAVADTSSHLFTSLHHLRLDRSRTARALVLDTVSATMDPTLRESRAGGMPALRRAIVALGAVDFPDQKSAVADLTQRVTKLAALHEESAQAMTRPKAERRSTLAPEYVKELDALIDTVDKLSLRLARLVKLDDALFDQLLAMKQSAWVARNFAGDASVLVTGLVAGQPVPPDAWVKFNSDVARSETAWAAVEEAAAGLPLPARFTEAVEKARRVYFTPEFQTLRANTLKAIIDKQPAGAAGERFTQISVPSLSTLLGVADTLLEVAKDYAAEQRADAGRYLAILTGLLGLAGLVAFGMIFMIVRRITSPLQAMRDAMARLANGDLTAEVPCAGRQDEIGGLADAMQVFKTSMTETNRLRGERREAEKQAAEQRKAEMARLADEFQAAVGNIVDAVSVASTDLEHAAKTLTSTAESTQQLSSIVATASTQASANVQTVASAAEEMAGSVDEIAKRVHESSTIASEAVQQAEKTDARITELSQAASRIGDVVKLITAIAEQTNLLALNATIEAARAGDAGRGFAVVAQEVKALAAQTAKATDEIGTQIASMQTATQDSVTAIKEIGGTIGRISEIAAAIAAAVQEQGAATQEISRNVHQAAQGTSQVASNITDVSRGASETGTASAQVLGSAQSLSRESGRLKSEVERFLHTVRGAA